MNKLTIIIFVLGTMIALFFGFRAHRPEPWVGIGYLIFCISILASMALLPKQTYKQ